MFPKKFMMLLFASFLIVPAAHAAAPELIAIGTVSGAYEDFATETSGVLENGFPGNRLGGIGSGFAYAGGTTFLALPDRGPNATPFDSNLMDDTVSFIDRFHTFNISLSPSDPGSDLPFTATPMLVDTTLLSSASPLVYGSGAGLGDDYDGDPIGSGAPFLNAVNHTHYFTGRSDNFDPSLPSTNPADARLDPEALRVSNNGNDVFISDEYGPYVYQFSRATGRRVKSFALPANLAITSLSSQKSEEIANNTVGRVTNKGMEGLAITPDGNMLVGIMQANLEQDEKGSLRIVTINIHNGATHEYGYQLTDGSGASEILALNNHQFIVDERKGNGMADTPGLYEDATPAVHKKLFLIDLDGAVDITDVAALDLDAHPEYAVDKTLFLDVVDALTGAGIDPLFIPSKIEGLAFGQDVVIDEETKHTLYITNDNDFLATIADPTVPACVVGPPCARGLVANPNVFYVFSFGDDDLPEGFDLVPQPF